ncbi:murein DD-endopeptidase MepM/ murein hydrolase activator NlpD [Rubricella aquisinus]|uniref:Murein DD-endopeptidase MepM/ murein hydrolase activator NlpD n=1 Tax=Rubricella aquisinus TaxID=2028108 RepID=A0A840WI13_9RHOB|nr:DUF5930 domain-containing protein [Rubricella aquisinus]MBB5514768.1 murein DD-endopeptidase MepM/ murein hydrolase activator NlpD [Rubricella aquisinus]
MTGTTRRKWRVLPDRTIYLRTDEKTYFRTFSPVGQVLAVLGLVCFGVGGTVGITSLVMSSVGQLEATDQLEVVRDVYEQRIDRLSADRALLSGNVASAQARAKLAQETVTSLHGELVGVTQALNAAELAHAATQAQLDEERAARVRLEAQLAEAQAEIAHLSTALAAAEFTRDDMEAALAQIATSLHDRSVMVESLAADNTLLAQEQEATLTEIALLRQQQERVYSRMEDAVDSGLAALEDVFKRAGTDVEALMDTIMSDYTGQGGPEVLIEGDEGAVLKGDLPVLAPVSLDPGAEDPRAEALFQRMERLNQLRVAMQNMPFAHPVQVAHRFTSRFGPRRDPFNGTRRQHNGLDFAARTGTPITAAGDGVVTWAGTMGAYGRVVKIQHEFGYETLYAHLHRVRVSVGDTVRQGDRIGDMGNTGRSTGTHLHYEIRKDGRPVDPLNYVRAASDVL